MGQSFQSFYKFRNMGNSKLPVFLQCINGVWACQIGYDWKNAHTDTDMNKAMLKAIYEYENYSGINYYKKEINHEQLEPVV